MLATFPGSRGLGMRLHIATFAQAQPTMSCILLELKAIPYIHVPGLVVPPEAIINSVRSRVAKVTSCADGAS